MELETVAIQLPDVASPVNVAIRRGCAGSGGANLPPALLLHGMYLSSYSWRYVQQYLTDQRETLAIDFPGFGRSDKPRTMDYSLHGLTRMVIALMDALGIQRTAWIGHSLGGGVALMGALTHSDRVERIGLINSIAYPQPEPPFVTWPQLPFSWLTTMIFHRLFIKSLLQAMYMDKTNVDETAVREYALSLRSFDGVVVNQRLYRSLRNHQFGDYIARYPSLDLPLLIIHGDRDNVVPLRVAQRLHSEVLGSQYVVLEGKGHMLIEEEPQTVARLLDLFLIQGGT